MSTARITQGASGVLHIAGDLNLRTVPQLYTDSKPLLETMNKAVVDLSGVARANSAGLILLLEWLDEAGAAQRSVQFRHIPESLLDIARVSNVLQLLPQVADRQEPAPDAGRRSSVRRKKRRSSGR